MRTSRRLPPEIAYVVFERGVFLGFFLDRAAAERLVMARQSKGPHEIIVYGQMT